MVTKTINYTNYNGENKTGTYYFNLNKVELTEWEYSMDGGLSKFAQKVIDAQDTAALIKLFKDLLARSYGVKSEDGERFRKSEKITEEFLESEAYPTLFMELATNSQAATDFINHLVPSDVAAEVEKDERYQKILAQPNVENN